ncbi:PHD finger protein rhinoceros-like [Saccostrea cucullata]|uniref:PHD finger protein rhinoceros-like n=1 Tax=Saccostrea cuccullata TaxID=36930 RepID=UPI002ED68728
MDSAVSSRDLIIRNIDELLLKLTEHGEESLLMTADGASLHVTGSEKGKKFLSLNRQIAEQFHKYCFDVQEQISEYRLSDKSPASFRRFPIVPKTAITVTSIKEVDSDFEVDQEETEVMLNAKDSSFTVFNIENQECQSRKFSSGLLDSTSPGKRKQERLKNIRVQIQRGGRKTEITLPEKPDLTVESKQTSVKSRLHAPDQTGEASQTIKDSQQSLVNDEMQNLSSDSVASKVESEARNVSCESKEVDNESNQAGLNTSTQKDLNAYGTGTNETVSCDATGDHTDSEDHSEPMDSVDTFVDSPVKASDSETLNNNQSGSQGKKQKLNGESCQESPHLNSDASYQAIDIDNHATADKIKDCPETAIAGDGDTAQVFHGNQASSENPPNAGVDMEVDTPSEGGTSVDQTSGGSLKKKGKGMSGTEKEQKKRKISRSPQCSPTRKKIRRNPEIESGLSHLETTSETTKEDESVAIKKITSAKENSEETVAKERSKVTSEKKGSEGTSAKERSKGTSTKERSELTSAKGNSEVATGKEISQLTSAKEQSNVTSVEKSSKKNSVKEISEFKPLNQSSDVGIAKETSQVPVRSPDNSPSKCSENIKIKDISKSTTKSMQLPIKSPNKGDKSRLFKKSLVVELEKIPDETIKLLGKSQEKAASELTKKPITEQTEKPTSEQNKSPTKGGNKQIPEDKELTPNSKAKPQSESKKSIIKQTEIPTSELNKSMNGSNTQTSESKELTSKNIAKSPKSKKPIAEKITRPAREVEKSPLKGSSKQNLESKELNPESIAKYSPELEKSTADNSERPASELQKSPLKEAEKSPMKGAEKSPMKGAEKSPRKGAEKSPRKRSSTQTLESKELTPESIAKSPEFKKSTAETCENTEKPLSEQEKSPLKGSSLKTIESKVLTSTESKKTTEKAALKSKKRAVSEVCDKPKSKSQKSSHRIKDLSTDKSEPRIADIPATESKESMNSKSDTLILQSKKSTPNDKLATESKMSTGDSDVHLSESKSSTPVIKDDRAVESPSPSSAVENKATISKDEKVTSDKSSQKCPAKIIIKQPLLSDIAGKGKCDLKNFKIDLKALAMGLALQRQKKS